MKKQRLEHCQSIETKGSFTVSVKFSVSVSVTLIAM